ncbi:MAG: dTDP-4-dehydrorhamnose reductase [Anaerolineaceae bacterium 4572_32.2]|nr:MAG: dTDP-4-dehydrorhamnose reductase [Anaerolineaceae bacterium 4572_32.2]
MRIFITGCKGQLGRALYEPLADHTLSGCDLPELDVTDRAAIGAAVAEFAPDVVIHAAAWTNVDGCARDPEQAYRANTLGTQNVALACAACDAALVYISTNEVFDGEATEPYREWDPPHPINPYARSKAAGEWFVRHLLNRFYIARTAWLYAPGGRNFSNPNRIIQLADDASTSSAQGGALKVVADEIGNPTYAPDLAAAIAALIQTQAYGIYHLVNAGHCSRYEFVREVLRISGREHVPVEPISLDDFERASTPPRFAPLANTAAAALGIELRPWQKALTEYLKKSQ